MSETRKRESIKNIVLAILSITFIVTQTAIAMDRNTRSLPARISHRVLETQDDPEYALYKASSIGTEEDIDELIRKGANPNTVVGLLGPALHVTSVLGNVEQARALIRGGALINAKFIEGRTALHIALQEKNYENAKLLIQEKDICINEV